MIQPALHPSPARMLAAASLATLLAACGGGGGGATATAQQAGRIAIAESNATAIAAEALNASNATGSVSGYVGTAVVIDAGAAPSHALMNAVARALRIGQQAVANAPGLAVGAAISLSQACTGGGSISITGNVASQSAPSAGDQVQLAFNACVESGQTASGALTLVLASVNGDASLMVVDLTASAFTVGTALLGGRIDGAMHVTLDDTNPNTTSLSLSSAGLTATRLVNGGVRSSYTLSDFQYRLDTSHLTGADSETFHYAASGSFANLGSVSFDAATTQPVVTPLGASVPSSGAGVVTGANGSSVAITVLNTGLQLDVDRNGDSVVDTTLVKSWAEVDAQL